MQSNLDANFLGNCDVTSGLGSPGAGSIKERVLKRSGIGYKWYPEIRNFHLQKK